MLALLAALWRWLWGGEEEEERKAVSLSEIPTWLELLNDNRQQFVDASKGDQLEEYENNDEFCSKVSLYEGDITCLKVDGIVRSTDTTLTSATGISGAIQAAAGSRLVDELKSLGGCKPGEAKTSLGYDLPAKYIVHTAGPTKEDSKTLEKCYRSCFNQMELKQMSSLAFCCISTGLQGYPNDKAVLVALRTVRLWFENLKANHKITEIDRIVFCLYSETDVILYSIWMQIFFPCPLRSNAPLLRPTTPYEADRRVEEIGDGYDAMVSSLEMSIQIETKKWTLLPLPGFIEITSEPDMISLDNNPDIRRARMRCGHVIGTESMTEYCKNIIRQGKYKFYCPDQSCNQEWDYCLMCHVACLSEYEKRQIEKRITRNFLKKEKGIQRCPGCHTWCSRIPGTGNCVRCPMCTTRRGKKFDFCWTCLSEWKHFRSCGNPRCNGKDTRIQILATCPTKVINYCKDCPTIRGCPQCGLLIQHTDKCGHVNCTNCTDYGFCFICLMEKKDGVWQCRPYFNTCVLAPRQTSLPGTG